MTTPHTCPPQWWLSNRLLLKRNQDLLAKAEKTADRAIQEQCIALAVLARQMFQLHAEMEASRLDTLANHMELYGISKVPDSWLEETV